MPSSLSVGDFCRFVAAFAPSVVEIRLDARARKSVSVRPDIEGEPADGFRLKDLRVMPSRVWLAGARSQVLGLEEVVTQPIVLNDLRQTEEREVRLFLGGGSVWKEDDQPVRVVIEIEPLAPEVPPEGLLPAQEETG